MDEALSDGVLRIMLMFVLFLADLFTKKGLYSRLLDKSVQVQSGRRYLTDARPDGKRSCT